MTDEEKRRYIRRAFEDYTKNRARLKTLNAERWRGGLYPPFGRFRRRERDGKRGSAVHRRQGRSGQEVRDREADDGVLRDRGQAARRERKAGIYLSALDKKKKFLCVCVEVRNFFKDVRILESRDIFDGGNYSERVQSFPYKLDPQKVCGF